MNNDGLTDNIIKHSDDTDNKNDSICTLVVVIADELVKRSGITEDSIYAQQEVIDDGILSRVNHYGLRGK
jgi:hypothetical protein